MLIWLTTKDVAAALGVSRKTVTRDIVAGVLEASQRKRPSGRSRIRVHVDALREYARHDPGMRDRVDHWLSSHRSTGHQQGQQGH